MLDIIKQIVVFMPTILSVLRQVAEDSPELIEKADEIIRQLDELVTNVEKIREHIASAVNQKET